MPVQHNYFHYNIFRFFFLFTMFHNFTATFLCTRFPFLWKINNIKEWVLRQFLWKWSNTTSTNKAVLTIFHAIFSQSLISTHHRVVHRPRPAPEAPAAPLGQLLPADRLPGVTHPRPQGQGQCQGPGHELCRSHCRHVSQGLLRQTLQASRWRWQNRR